MQFKSQGLLKTRKLWLGSESHKWLEQSILRKTAEHCRSINGQGSSWWCRAINTTLLQTCSSSSRIKLNDIKKIATTLGDATFNALVGTCFYWMRQCKWVCRQGESKSSEDVERWCWAAEVHSFDLVKKGNYHLISWSIQRNSLVSFIHLVLLNLILHATIFSVLRMVRQNPSNCHHVKSAYRNIFSGQTIKHKSGNDVFDSIQ